MRWKIHKAKRAIAIALSAALSIGFLNMSAFATSTLQGLGNSVSIYAIDTRTGQGVPGVEITVSKSVFNSKVITGKTDSSGLLIADNLVNGDFEYKQSANLSGYLRNNTTGTFSIKGDEAPEDCVLDLSPVEVNIALPAGNENADIEVFDKAGAKFAEVTSNKKGIVSLFYVPEGEYTYRKQGEDADIGSFSVDDKGNVTGSSLSTESEVNQYILTVLDNFTEKIIPGASITILDSEGKSYATAATNVKGQLVLNGIPAGEYVISADPAPSGYLPNQQCGTFTVDDNGLITGDNIAKLEPSMVEFWLAVDGYGLANVPLTVADALDNKVADGKTNADGKLVVRYLDIGVPYTVAPDTLPAGFVLVSPGSFQIAADGAVNYGAELTVMETKVLISVVDEESTPIPDVSISVFNSAGTEIKKDVTNTVGNVVFSSLPVGNYTFTVTPPKGFSDPLDPYAFEITSSGSVIGDDTVVLKADTGAVLDGDGKFVITTVDAESLQPVTGVEYTVSSQDTVLLRSTSDDSGEVVVDGVNPGTYTFQQSEVPEEYVQDNETYSVVVKEDLTVSGTTEVKIKAKSKSPRNITVVDATTNEGIRNVNITVFDKDSKSLGTITTNDSGIADLNRMSTLPTGKYRFKVVAPSDYLENDTLYMFEIDEAGEMSGTVSVKLNPKNQPSANTPPSGNDPGQGTSGTTYNPSTVLDGTPKTGNVDWRFVMIGVILLCGAAVFGIGAAGIRKNNKK